MNLLRAGRVFVFEPPPGVRANLLRTFSTLPASRMGRVSAPLFLLVVVGLYQMPCSFYMNSLEVALLFYA